MDLSLKDVALLALLALLALKATMVALPADGALCSLSLVAFFSRRSP